MNKFANILILLVFSQLSFFSISIFSSVTTTLKINEVLASNAFILKSESGEYFDWLELYNYGNEPINLNGYRIGKSDNFENAYILPDTVIQAGEYLLIWASNKNINNTPILSLKGNGIGFVNHKPVQDYGSFNYINVSDDFEAIVKINSIESKSEDASVVFMLREELDSASRWYGIGFDKTNRIIYTKNVSKNPYETGIFSNFHPLFEKSSFPNCWAKITRSNNIINVFFSYDRFFWHHIYNDSVPGLMNSAYLGLFLYSKDTETYLKVNIEEFELNNKFVKLNSIQNIDYSTELPTKKYISNEIHTDFKISLSGDELYLWDTNGNLIDNLQFEECETDISIGRDEQGNIVYYDRPTPGKENNKEKYNFLSPPVFSIQGGYFHEPFELEILSPDNANIYYTLDFSEPTTNSLKYNAPITIDKTSIVRAKAFQAGAISSNIATNSYLFEKEGNLPTISMVIPEEQLYDRINGILYEKKDELTGKIIESNIFKKIAASGNFEFIVNNNDLVNSTVGYRLRGGSSRHLPQKHFNIMTGKKYKSNGLEYKFFKEKDITHFPELVLRNSGNDFEYGFIRDAFVSVLAINSGTHNDASSYLACRTYLNGEYYGILNLREKSNEDFLETNYGYSSDNYSIVMASGMPSHNSSQIYNELLETVVQLDATNDSLFNMTFQDIDLDNLIDFHVTKFFVADIDWHNNNNKLWKNTKTDSKWRHLLYDSDMSLSWRYITPDLYTISYFTNNYNITNSSLILRKAWENVNFRKQFLNRTADLVNYHFSPEKTIPILDSLTNILKSEMPLHRQRWQESAVNWGDELDNIRNFLNERGTHLLKHFTWIFSLSGLQKTTVSVEPPEAGQISINSIPFISERFEGYYFRTIPITIHSKPNKGWRFAGWSSKEYKNNKSIEVTPNSSSFSIKAKYEKILDANKDIVINEIMYRAAPNAFDWCELYNNSDYTIDLSNWIMKDDNENNIFIIPDGTIVEPASYLVLAQNLEDFQNTYPDVDNVIGSFEFGLGRNDQVRIYDQFGDLRDSVDYTNIEPWPIDADATGKSIELISPDLDNTLPENWKTSNVLNGTPGKANSTSVNVNNQNVYKNINLFYDKINDLINIKFEQQNNIEVNINIFDINGKKYAPLSVKQFFNHVPTYVTIHTDMLQSGVYFLNFEFRVGNSIEKDIRKIIITK